MGRIVIPILLANQKDLIAVELGSIQSTEVRSTAIDGVVDTGAVRLVLPERLAAELGLPISGTASVRYADHRTAQRNVASHVQLTIGDRTGTFNAILEPMRTTALIGAIVMEDLDLVADCVTGAVYPRDAKQIIAEIE